MRNFVIALILLVFAIIFTAVNAIVICNICDEITAYLDSGNEKQAVESWEKHEHYISAFTHDAEIDAVNLQAQPLTNGNLEDGERKATLLRFREAVAEIKNCQTARFFSLF